MGFPQIGRQGSSPSESCVLCVAISKGDEQSWLSTRRFSVYTLTITEENGWNGTSSRTGSLVLKVSQVEGSSSFRYVMLTADFQAVMASRAGDDAELCSGVTLDGSLGPVAETRRIQWKLCLSNQHDTVMTYCDGCNDVMQLLGRAL